MIKLLATCTPEEVWGADGHVTFFFWEFSFCCFLSSNFKGFSKERSVLLLSSPPSQGSRVGFVSLELLAQPPQAHGLCLETCCPLGCPKCCCVSASLSCLGQQQRQRLSLLAILLSKEAKNKFIIAFYALESQIQHPPLTSFFCLFCSTLC